MPGNHPTGARLLAPIYPRARPDARLNSFVRRNFGAAGAWVPGQCANDLVRP